MAEGQRLEAWDHTASKMTLLANCHRNASKKRRPYDLTDFHPYRDASQRARSGLRICRENKELLKQVVNARKRRRAT